MYLLKVLVTILLTFQVQTLKVQKHKYSQIFSQVFKNVSTQSLQIHQEDRNLLARCEERFIKATSDHFSYVEHQDCAQTYEQRYFVCDNRWGKKAPTPCSPIFMYMGNEANIELFINNTGLMWEHSQEFGALMVFAEHRYYGKSLPCVRNYKNYTNEQLRFLSAQQAMEDFVDLTYALKQEFDLSDKSPVIGFGGSYGGMLAAWMRLKYAHVIDGSIAGSAPIWIYPGVDQYDTYGFYKVVSRDYLYDGGENCKNNIQKLWKYLFQLGKSNEGRKLIAKQFKICNKDELSTENSVLYLAEWIQEGLTAIGQGNYPFSSNYLTFGGYPMPAWPVRQACLNLKTKLEGEQLMDAVRSAVGVFYNASGNVECYKLSASQSAEESLVELAWGYQTCTEQYIVMEANGVTDMFWPQQFDPEEYSDYCYEKYGVRPRPYQASREWGGKKISFGSNIVFSNGLYDPWSSAGVLYNISDTLVSSIIPQGAHHLDLMFSNPNDPPSVIATRQLELKNIEKWINQACSLDDNNSQYDFNQQVQEQFQ